MIDIILNREYQNIELEQENFFDLKIIDDLCFFEGMFKSTNIEIENCNFENSRARLFDKTKNEYYEITLEEAFENGK